jgi:hypothetical protein
VTFKQPPLPPFMGGAEVSMSMSIGSVGGAALAAGSAAQQYSGAVAVTAQSVGKERDREAVDLLRSAMTTSSSGTGQLVNTYA